MKKKTKLYLSLGLASLLAIAAYLCEEIIIDHTKDICITSKVSYALGFEDFANNHQVRAINRKDIYNAQYVKNIVVFNNNIRVQEQYDSSKIKSVYFSEKYNTWIDYEDYNETIGTNVSAYRDEHIIIYEIGNEHPKELRIR